MYSRLLRNELISQAKYRNLSDCPAPISRTMSPYPRKLFSALLLALLFPFIAISQYGPMGIGNKDGSPTFAGPQPRLLLWLDGSSAQPFPNTGGAGGQPYLTEWRDKSGNGHHFVPSVDGHYNPYIHPSQGPKGTYSDAQNRPAVSFTATETF